MILSSQVYDLGYGEGLSRSLCATDGRGKGLNRKSVCNGQAWGKPEQKVCGQRAGVVLGRFEGPKSLGVPHDIWLEKKQLNVNFKLSGFETPHSLVLLRF